MSPSTNQPIDTLLSCSPTQRIAPKEITRRAGGINNSRPSLHPFVESAHEIGNKLKYPERAPDNQLLLMSWKYEDPEKACRLGYRYPDDKQR